MEPWQLETFEPSQLPAPARGLPRLRSDLDRFGYCLLAGALSPEVLVRLRTRLDQQALAEEQAGIAYFDGAPHQNWGSFRDEDGKPRAERFSRAAGGVNQRLWMLVNKGQVFLELLAHPRARELVGHVLGEQYILSSYIANIANPGGVPMQLHTDQWWAPQATRRGRRPLPVGSITRERFDTHEGGLPPMIAAPACCNIMWMLDDFSEENGATLVVPGTHLSGCQPARYRGGPVHPIPAVAPAGTAMIFEGRLWHGTGANHGNAARRGLLSTFCGPQFRPQENYTVGTRAAVRDCADDDLKALLGLRLFGGYGRTDSPLVDLVDPTAEPVGVLTPDTPRPVGETSPT